MPNIQLSRIKLGRAAYTGSRTIASKGETVTITTPTGLSSLALSGKDLNDNLLLKEKRASELQVEIGFKPILKGNLITTEHSVKAEMMDGESALRTAIYNFRTTSTTAFVAFSMKDFYTAVDQLRVIQVTLDIPATVKIEIVAQLVGVHRMIVRYE
jgi:hypothetical protein